MFTPCPDGAALAGEDGTGAGADVAAWAVGPDAVWLAAGDGRGHSRKAPRPARASTMAIKAILRCADVRSMVRNYCGGGSGGARTGRPGPSRRAVPAGTPTPPGPARRACPWRAPGPRRIRRHAPYRAPVSG